MTITAITLGLDTYTHKPAWNIAEAAESRASVESLLARHGVQQEDWSARATNAEIKAALDELSNRIEDSLIIYWVGHGEYSSHGYRVALADSAHPLTARNAVSSADWWETLRDQWNRRKTNGYEDSWVLVVLDTCGSGDGIREMWRTFEEEPENLALIAGADEGAAYVGRLAGTLQHLLEEGYNGNDSAGIPLFDLMRRLEARIGKKHVRHTFEKWSPAVLPLSSDTPPALQAPRDTYEELRNGLATAPPEVRNHFYAKAQASEIGELAWHFTGRESERREISAWLRDASDGMFAVSGVAGSGKSALLGMLLATSDDQVNDALAKIGEITIRDELRPVGVSFDAVLHLSGRTVADAVAALSAALGFGTGEDMEALLRATGSPEGGRLTVLVDALDESRDPLTIATDLRRLAALPGVRVLVGTRQSMHEDPDHPDPPDCAILDTLAPERVIRLPREPDAVLRYVESRLRLGRSDLTDARVTDLAKTVARYEQPFLFARLAISEIIAEPELADIDDLLARVLGSGHSGIFGHAVGRLARAAPEVEALLHALTYARGNGFPRTGGIWALSASELAETPLNDVHVEKALELGAPFIMQDSEFGQSVYRLAHRTFAEWYLRKDAQ
jgi:hypothetical protein